MKKERIENPRYPHLLRILRKELPDGVYSEDEETRILYEGCCRSYTDTTTTGDRQVVTNRRKLSIPVRFDGWKEAILYGDTVEVRIGNIEEAGFVTDFEPDNNRTVVYWELIRE